MNETNFDRDRTKAVVDNQNQSLKFSEHFMLFCEYFETIQIDASYSFPVWSIHVED